MSSQAPRKIGAPSIVSEVPDASDIGALRLFEGYDREGSKSHRSILSFECCTLGRQGQVAVPSAAIVEAEATLQDASIWCRMHPEFNLRGLDHLQSRYVEDEIRTNTAAKGVFWQKNRNASPRNVVFPVQEGEQEEEDNFNDDLVVNVDDDPEPVSPLFEGNFPRGISGRSTRSRADSKATASRYSSRESTPRSRAAGSRKGSREGTPKSGLSLQLPSLSQAAWSRNEDLPKGNSIRFDDTEVAYSPQGCQTFRQNPRLARAFSSLSGVFSLSLSPLRPRLNRAPTIHSISQRRTWASMVSLKLSSPELLRATRAAEPLRGLGRVLRDSGIKTQGFGRSQAPLGSDACSSERLKRAARGDSFDEYQLSFETRRIDTFWSHSWRANAWRKVFVLYLYYNQFPAATAGGFAALLAMVLDFMDLLPHMSDAPSLIGTLELGAWASLFGVISFFIILISWRPRDRVFLDKVCIHQKDQRLKKEGVESIGAFLLHSQTMLVLWDTSYAQRLWCVFEMAAFAWAHRDDLKNRVEIRPLVFAPVFFGLFLTSAVNWILILFPPKSLILGVAVFPIIYACIAVVGVHFLRRFHRDMTTLRQQLNEFKVSNTQCFCCTVGHKDPDTGIKISCDREVIQACIVAWFGSLDEFEDFVQVELTGYFWRSLGRFGLPFRWVLGSQLPVLWAYMDLIADRHHFMAPDGALNWLLLGAHVIEGLAMWLFASPLCIAFAIWVTNCFQTKRSWKVHDGLVSMFAALLVLVPVVLLTISWYVSRFLLSPNPIIGACVFFIVTAELTVAVFKWGRGDRKMCCF
jgi:hypothetical protein